MNKKMIGAVALVMCLLAAALCPVFANDANAVGGGGGDDPPAPTPGESLCITATGGNVKIFYSTALDNLDVQWWNQDKEGGAGWVDWENESSLTVPEEGLYIYNTSETLCTFEDGFSFVIEESDPGATVSLSGDITDMIGGSALSPYCFSGIFMYMTILTDASELKLPSTVENSCYMQMFLGCNELKKAPELPAQDLTDITNCYMGMFEDCTKLSSLKCFATNCIDKNCNDILNNTTSGILYSLVDENEWIGSLPDDWDVQQEALVELDYNYPPDYPSDQNEVYMTTNLKLAEPSEPPAPVGYEFGGWYGDEGFTEKIDWNIKVFDAGQTTTVFAKWIPGGDEKCTITYDANDGTGEKLPHPDPVSKGDTYTIEDFTDGKKGELVFVGWNDSKDGKGKQYLVGEKITVKDDMTLYAQYDAASNIHKVKFNTDGGSDAPSDITKIAKGWSFTVPDYKGTKSGYKFDGWSCNGETYEVGEKVTMGDKDMEFKAIWVADSPSNSSNDNTVMIVSIIIVVIETAAIVGCAMYFWRLQK